MERGRMDETFLKENRKRRRMHNSGSSVVREIMKIMIYKFFERLNKAKLGQLLYLCDKNQSFTVMFSSSFIQ